MSSGSASVGFILPVIFFEFLSIAVTKALIPRLLVSEFDSYVYHVIGVVETVKGVLAFVSCPLFGMLSDKVGRKVCLLVTVAGTTAPVCLLAFTLNLKVYVVAQGLSGMFAATFTLTFAYIADVTDSRERAPAYGLALATLGLSFTVGPVTGSYIAKAYTDKAVFLVSLLFAVADVLYIILVLPESKQASVEVQEQAAAILRRRIIDPISSRGRKRSQRRKKEKLRKRRRRRATKWRRQWTKDSSIGGGSMGHPSTWGISFARRVLMAAVRLVKGEEGKSRGDAGVRSSPKGSEGKVGKDSLVLTVRDGNTVEVPTKDNENRNDSERDENEAGDYDSDDGNEDDDNDDDGDNDDDDNEDYEDFDAIYNLLPRNYSPLDALGIFTGDPLLSQLARVTFLYYTGVWAVVSTLMVYLVNRFGISKLYIGYLLGCYGAATMLSEGVLVRILVPLLGERLTIRIGLTAFALQCVVAGLAWRVEHIWASIFLSLFSNLVYPSLSSLVSSYVPAAKQGEAQGAINGVRALTEGFGPLMFGLMMNIFEDTAFPGMPYLLGGAITGLAIATSFRLPDEITYARFLAAQEAQDLEKAERIGLLSDHGDDEDGRSGVMEYEEEDYSDPDADSDDEDVFPMRPAAGIDAANYRTHSKARGSPKAPRNKKRSAKAARTLGSAVADSMVASMRVDDNTRAEDSQGGELRT